MSDRDHTGFPRITRFPPIAPVVHEIGLVDGEGRPLVLLVSAGQANDSHWLPTLSSAPGAAERTRIRCWPTVASTPRSDRARLRAARVVVTIPESRPTLPPDGADAGSADALRSTPNSTDGAMGQT